MLCSAHFVRGPRGQSARKFKRRHLERRSCGGSKARSGKSLLYSPNHWRSLGGRRALKLRQALERGQLFDKPLGGMNGSLHEWK